MSLQLLIHKANTGQATLPPLYPIRFDWHIALGTELLAFVIMAGLVEEILFRGVIYQALRKRFSLARSLIFSTLIFALFHLDFVLNPYAMIYVVFFGLIAAFLFEQTRSLNICISFHIAGNATEVLVRYLTHIIPI
jgi:membrane protease YdiL (CAAX protease family)